jgi:hypothetical protein
VCSATTIIIVTLTTTIIITIITASIYHHRFSSFFQQSSFHFPAERLSKLNAVRLTGVWTITSSSCSLLFVLYVEISIRVFSLLLK